MEEDPPPFWLQNHHANHHHDRRRHRRTWTLFFNTGVLILILMLAAMVFLIIAIPYVISLARQVFDPNLVKTSWNSLNIVLVLFAILCGFLSKKDDDQNNQTPRSTPLKQEVIDNNDHNLAQSSTHQWYNNDFQNDRMRRLLRRNSNSYPDLRQDSPWVVKENVWKSYDDQYYQFQRSDSQVFGYYTSVSRPQEVSTLKTPPPPSSPPLPPPLPLPLPQPPQAAVEVVSEDETDAKVIEIDAEVLSVSSEPSLVLSPISTHSTTDPPLATTYLWPPPSSPPPPPPPPPPPRQAHSSKAIKKKVKQRDEEIGNEGKWDFSIDQSQSKSKEMESRKYKEDNKNEKSHKKRGGVSVTKEFLTSFYHQRKRKKKQKRMSYDNLDEVFEPPKVSIHRSKSTPEFPPPSPPPPPPPPPPTSAIKTIFPSRKNKTKQVPYVITTPIPPPSPPPPPPPPPFKMPSWKFIMQGDYANMDSYNNSPRSGYSASEEDDGSPSTRKTSSPVPTLLCPSPDVNIKADDFIARFRAKLTLEKMNSIKQKQGTGPSPLGMDFGQN